MTRLLLCCTLLWPLFTGCSTDAPPPTVYALETKADSAAMRAWDATGGPEAWAALPFLRFDFGTEERAFRKHLWDRQTGRYRVEWQQGDSTYVVLFDTGTREGTVHLNGAALPDSLQADALAQAHRSFINDTYWLLMPTKLFDDGVTRSYVADSSDATHDVIALQFADVGLTPGDQYWVWIDRASGDVTQWAYHLQNYAPDRPASAWRWTGWEAHDTEAGPLRVAIRKENDAGRALLTNAVAMPADVDEALFTDPLPRLYE